MANAGCIEFLDFRFRLTTLVFVGIKNGRAVLRANVAPLAIQLRWVVGIEKNVEQLIVADLLWIVRNSNHLGVPGVSFANTLIVGGFFVPPA